MTLERRFRSFPSDRAANLGHGARYAFILDSTLSIPVGRGRLLFVNKIETPGLSTATYVYLPDCFRFELSLVAVYSGSTWLEVSLDSPRVVGGFFFFFFSFWIYEKLVQTDQSLVANLYRWFRETTVLILRQLGFWQAHVRTLIREELAVVFIAPLYYAIL